jgi:peptide/nickel transport system permease protein
VGTYIIRRLLAAIPTLIVISMVIFSILKLAPGDPMSEFAANPSVPPEVRENIRQQLGLNDPIPVQYYKWATSWIQGDWGYSFKSRSPVRDWVAQRIPTTLFVMGMAFLLGLLIALPIGILAAVKQYSIFDNIATTFAFFGFSVPTFLSGLVFMLVFAINLRWFPIVYQAPGGSEGLLYSLKSAAMPVMVLGLFTGARLMRFTRASMLENIRLDYVRTARAKGMKERAVIGTHVVRNALIPVVTIIALELPGIFGGAVVTEQIFRVNGIGDLLITSIRGSDVPVVMAIVFIISILVVLSNLLADVVYGILDPRIKYS